MEKVFSKADLHCHSKYSPDGYSSIETILEKAKQENLVFIAITDHNTIEGAVKAQKIASDFGVEVIIGEEIDTKVGHLIGLFLSRHISPWRTLSETIKEIHEQGGLAIAPHPGSFPSGIPLSIIAKVFNHLDGIETFNGGWNSVIWIGKKKQKQVERLNREIFHLASTGGSDAHISSQVGSGYTVFQGKTSSELYKAIKEKKTFTGGQGWNFSDYINLQFRGLTRLPLFIKNFKQIFNRVRNQRK
ncbi:PHP domain-containing protein [Candidatus Parcubacteria bacterium]|nr:PHP domain-containing protein [Candidatus Parcubacteria bacterium]